METARSVGLPRLALALIILVLGSALPQSLWAQATLENPQPVSLQSGIGVISGWVCTATQVEIEIDGGARMQAAYGTSREDTRSVCSDANNGFGLLVNWNLFGEGAHTLRALADGVEFAQVAFVVATLGLGEFPRGLGGSFTIEGFPQAGSTVQLSWQESLQNFVLTGSGSGSGGSGGAPPRVLENPQPGSAQSGIGVVSGWVCDATLIEIEIDGNTRLQAAYGTSRDDTRGACGDANNGFGLLINWNLFSDGTHTLRALADGVEFAQVTLTVTTLGLGEFIRGLSGRAELENFPEIGRQSRVQWEESLQNFVLEGALLAGEGESAGSVVEGTASDGQGGEAVFQATLPYDPRTLLLQLQALLSNSQTSVDPEALERQQAAGVFFACDERLSFEQGGRIFTSADFRWLDGAGNDVCREVAGGSTLETIVVVNPGVPLNFTLLFRILYNNAPVVDADAGGSPSPVLSVSEAISKIGKVA